MYSSSSPQRLKVLCATNAAFTRASEADYQEMKTHISITKAILTIVIVVVLGRKRLNKRSYADDRDDGNSTDKEM